MKGDTSVQISMTREEIHELFDELAARGRWSAVTDKGLKVTFVRENGEKRSPLGEKLKAVTQAAIEGAEEGGRAK